MKTLICGSLAYDSIMIFQGRFKDHILPDQVHILNVSFLVPTLRQEFGGVAGNIAYSLKLLGGEPLPLATIGENSAQYLQRLARLGIDHSAIRTIAGTQTAQAFITTDLDDNQIVAFHPGAMAHSHENPIPADPAIGLALVGPDNRDGILCHASALAARAIPFLFDPGQALPLFSGAELLGLVGRATFLAVNDYEARLLATKTDRSIEALAAGLEALVVTRGAQGSQIHAKGEVLNIPAAPVRSVIDPTGCGDAYRAGLLYGIAQGLTWASAGRLASVMGAIKVEHSGAQGHLIDRAGIADRFQAAFGYRPW